MGFQQLRGIALLTFLAVLAPSLAEASYLQFCRLEGDIVSEPKPSDGGVEFEFLVAASEAYEDPVFGEGWDGCDDYVGKVLSVRITAGDLGDEEYLAGQTRVVWRYAIELEVNGKASSVVGFSAVDQSVQEADE